MFESLLTYISLLHNYYYIYYIQLYPIINNNKILLLFITDALHAEKESFLYSSFRASPIILLFSHLKMKQSLLMD